MIVLLNLLSAIVVVGGIVLSAKLRKLWPLVTAAVFTILYSFFQPSYMPKGTVQRAELPPFEQSEAQIQDRALKPQDGSVYDARREQKIKDGLPFIEKGEK